MQPDIDRFWNKVNIGNETECWEWLASKNKNGYGKAVFMGKFEYAHRCSFYIRNGYFPEECMHTCDNRSCVNPNHLVDGTHIDNVKDSVSKNRHAFGSKNGMSKLSEDNVRSIRKKHFNGDSVSSIAKEYGITASNVNYIVKNKTWKKVI